MGRSGYLLDIDILPGCGLAASQVQYNLPSKPGQQKQQQAPKKLSMNQRMRQQRQGGGGGRAAQLLQQRPVAGTRNNNNKVKMASRAFAQVQRA